MYKLVFCKTTDEEMFDKIILNVLNKVSQPSESFLGI